MNDRTYIIPGLKGWTFRTSDTGSGLLSGNGGPGITVTAGMTPAEIAEQVKSTLWLRSRMTDEAATDTAKAVLIIDWQAMIREAGTEVQHQTPSLPGWTLKISDLGTWLWHIDGAGVPITADTPMSEITDGVRRVLLPILPPVEIDVQVDEVMRIDFRALILSAWEPRAATLLDGFTADNSALIESICADVLLLVSFQKPDSTVRGNEICALVRKIAE